MVYRVGGRRATFPRGKPLYIVLAPNESRAVVSSAFEVSLKTYAVQLLRVTTRDSHNHFEISSLSLENTVTEAIESCVREKWKFPPMSASPSAPACFALPWLHGVGMVAFDSWVSSTATPFCSRVKSGRILCASRSWTRDWTTPLSACPRYAARLSSLLVHVAVQISDTIFFVTRSPPRLKAPDGDGSLARGDLA